jgi:ribonuclease HI
LIEASVDYLRQLGKELLATREEMGGRHNSRCNRGPVRPAQNEPDSYWVPPEHGTIKINVDGAFNPASGEAAVGAIARDHDGNPLVMVWKTLYDCRDVEEVEAMACPQGVRMGDRWPENVMVTIETDCANVASKAQSSDKDFLVSSAIFGDIKQAMQRRGACRIQKAWREQNQIAHNLAKFALKSRSS